MTMILESANTTTWKILSEEGDYTGNTWNLDINTAGTFTLITNGAIDAFVGWGDGTSERLTATSGTTNFTHTYPSSGTYTVQLQLLSGDFYPYYNFNPAGDEIVTLNDTPDGWSFGTSLISAFRGSGDLITVGDIDTSSVTNFNNTWRDCASLTSFPLIDTSSVTNFQEAWYGCTSLTSFPLLDTSVGTSFFRAWRDCSGLTSFPLIDTSHGTNFSTAWYNCTSLDNITALGDTYSFPEINLSSGLDFTSAWFNCTSLTSFPELPLGKRPVDATDFANAWLNCSSLTTFPANFFDSWTGTPATNCFVGAWDNCSALTATSVENILNSIDTSGRSAPASGVDITIDYKVGEDISAVLGSGNAVDNLTGYISGGGKGWTVTLNGTLYS